MKVIHRRNITWHDLPAIENPFFARNEVAHSRDALLGASRIWGVDEMLRENLSSCLEPSEDYHHYGFGWLLESVDDGEAVLIHDSGWRRPMRSVLCWSMENGAHHIPGHGDILSVEGRWIADPDLPLLLRREIEKCLEQGRRDEALNRGLPEKSWWGLWDGSRSGAGNASASDAAAADEESER
ncbi:MAG: hypothetical protein LBI68_03700, partial [Azoarcus sp.]|nr:hypothetical protein [Azoarcus sp.]